MNTLETNRTLDRALLPAPPPEKVNWASADHHWSTFLGQLFVNSHARKHYIHKCLFSELPWRSKLFHACRKLLGNSFSGFQVMITCAITCQKFLGNNCFWAISGNLNFHYLLRIFYYLKLPLNSTNYLGGKFPLYWPSLPALSSSFLLRAVCRRAWMHNESVMNAWPELGANANPQNMRKQQWPPPPKKKRKISTFCTSFWSRWRGPVLHSEKCTHIKNNKNIYIYI